MRILTPQQHENATKALALIQSIPEERVDLNAFGDPCGSLNCTLGHCGTQLHFIEQGLHWGRKMLNFDSGSLKGCRIMFGDDSFSHLFSLVDDSPYDKLFREAFPDLPVRENSAQNTKALAIFRLQQWLQSSTVTTEGT